MPYYNKKGFEEMATTEEKVCPNCGKLDETGRQLCEQCGLALTPLGEPSREAVPARSGKKRRWIWLGAIAGAALLIYLALLGVHLAGKNELHQKVQRVWSRVEEDNGTYYTLELDFSEDSVCYNFDSLFSWLDMTIIEYDYEALSRDRLKIGDRVFSVQFDKTGTMMTLRPSLTDSGRFEYWFDHSRLSQSD